MIVILTSLINGVIVGEYKIGLIYRFTTLGTEVVVYIQIKLREVYYTKELTYDYTFITVIPNYHTHKIILSSKDSDNVILSTLSFIQIGV